MAVDLDGCDVEQASDEHSGRTTGQSYLLINIKVIQDSMSYVGFTENNVLSNRYLYKTTYYINSPKTGIGLKGCFIR